MTTTPSPDQRARFEPTRILEEVLIFHAGFKRGDAKTAEVAEKAWRAVWQATQPTPPREVAQGLREILDDIERAADHQIPFYAYGDNEAGCALARALEQVRNLVGQAAALAPYVTAPSSPAPASAETLGGDRHGGLKVPNELPVISSEPTSRATSAPTSGKEGMSRTVDLEELSRHTTEIVCGRDYSFEIVSTGMVARLERDLTAAREDVKTLQEQIGLQLAACDCAAMMDLPESHKQNLAVKRGNPAWSPAFDSVMRRTAECITLRATSEAMAGAMIGALEQKIKDYDFYGQEQIRASIVSKELKLLLSAIRAATPAQPDQLKKETT